ncbi:capsid cement protein [Azotobacter beijerinckii]|uniref:Predicted phage recombinase, RecA/RadA family n=1 Tax=Azotobacter beijerinckii TaxID=170623 RepID=A0A1I4GCX0_9GAMM|nr:capsid cement protein [Azotobacter beijerinckii]SFL26966.1 Predicted phage recombinase, RecA/RadA family [Azotobacter beijerinckii]
MAKNFVQDGDVLTLAAPAGGVVSGTAYAIGQLVVVALEDAAAGQPFQGHAVGVWQLPCATGLTAGAKVSLLDGGLVADGTASSVPCGKLVTAESGGFANVRLSN